MRLNCDQLYVMSEYEKDIPPSRWNKYRSGSENNHSRGYVTIFFMGQAVGKVPANGNIGTRSLKQNY